MEINIQTVGMTYPNGKQALKGLSLDLRSPSLVGLLGPNGAGKSTLMKLLVAALLPTTGSILVDGQPLTRVERQLKARLGYLPQDFGLFDELTVEQFLDYMAALKGLRSSRAVIRQVIRSVNLEEKGYLYRQENPADRRSQQIFPTEKAQSLKNSKARIETICYEWLAEALTPEEQAEFARLLEQIYLRCKEESKAGFPHLTQQVKETQ